MFHKKAFALSLVLALILIVSGCSSTDSLFGGNDSGELALSLADAPVNDIKEVNVTLKEVKVIRNEDGEEIKETITDFSENGGERTFDLLNLRFNEELLGQKSLPEGKYTEIRLMIAAAEDAQGNGPGAGKSEIVFKDGSTVGFFVPSQKLQLKHDFTIEDGKITRLLLDGDASKMVKAAGKSGLIILEPTSISIIDKTISGDVEGIAKTDTDGDGTNEAIKEYDVVIEALNSAGDVVKSTVATTKETTEDETRPAGSFKLRGLKEGTYTINAYAEDSSGVKQYELNTESKVEVTVTTDETNTILVDSPLILSSTQN